MDDLITWGILILVVSCAVIYIFKHMSQGGCGCSGGKGGGCGCKTNPEQGNCCQDKNENK